MLPETSILLFERPLPPFAPMTEKTREENLERFIPESVRINNGWYLTDEERKRFIEDAWAKPLP